MSSDPTAHHSPDSPHKLPTTADILTETNNALKMVEAFAHGESAKAEVLALRVRDSGIHASALIAFLLATLQVIDNSAGKTGITSAAVLGELRAGYNAVRTEGQS